MPLGLRPLSSSPLSAPQVGAVSVTSYETFRFSSDSFTTRVTDSPAHEYIPGRLALNFTLGRRLSQGDAGRFGPLIERSESEIELINADGQLDDMVRQYQADGRQLRIKIGAKELTSLNRRRVQPYNLFQTVYTSVAGEWYFERDVLRIRVENLATKLQDRLQSAVYTGTGGAGGTADMTGRTVPTAFGRCLNVPAQILDPTILSYDLHGGAIDAVTAVYDQGIDVPFSADYATYALLAAASIPAGTYSSNIAAGKIRLGSPPTGAVTADIRGDSTGGYTDKHGGIMAKIQANYSDLVPTEISAASFTALDTTQPASMGIFLPSGDQSTIEEVLAQVADSGGAYIGSDRSGVMRTRRLDVAQNGAADWRFNDRDIIEIERIRLPYGVPWKAWGVGYSRNWTVQVAGELAAGVTQDRRTFLEAPYRYAYDQNSSIAAAHATSSGIIKDTFLIDAAAAAAEATRLIGLYALGNALYRVVVKTALFSMEIGQSVRLTFPRWDLHGGKNGRIVSIYDNVGSATTEFEVFVGSGGTATAPTNPPPTTPPSFTATASTAGVDLTWGASTD